MVCPNCGRQIPDASPACPICGARIAGMYPAGAPAPYPAAPPGPYPVNAPGPYPPNPQLYPQPGGAGYPEPEKRIHTPSLVLSIIGLVFALIFTYVTYACSTIGLVMAVKHRDKFRTKAAFVMCVIGLVVAVINSVIGLILVFGNL